MLLERILDASLRELCTSWRFWALGVALSRLNRADPTLVEMGGGVGKPGDFAYSKFSISRVLGGMASYLGRVVIQWWNTNILGLRGALRRGFLLVRISLWNSCVRGCLGLAVSEWLIALPWKY